MNGRSWTHTRRRVSRNPSSMMSQQESMDEATHGAADDDVLSALYQEAVQDGMKGVTLSQALNLAKSFSAQPRAIAFPLHPRRYRDGV